jgi:hypothetical protein
MLRRQNLLRDRKTTGKPHAAKAELITGQNNQPESRMLRRQNLLRNKKKTPESRMLCGECGTYDGTENPPESRMLRRQNLLRDRKTHRKAACCESGTYYGTATTTGKQHAAKAELITGLKNPPESRMLRSYYGAETPTGKPHAAKSELSTAQKHQWKAASCEGRTYYGTEKPNGKPHAAKAELITGQNNPPESRMLRRQNL